MEFVFFTNEFEEVFDLVKKIFNIDTNNNTFILQDNQKILLLKDENKVIGLSMITLKNDPFKNKKSYYIDYVCIKEEYRHKSLGRKMFDTIIEIAKENNIDYIELTSNKSRVEARKMYFDCGMSIKDTDVFIKQI